VSLSQYGSTSVGKDRKLADPNKGHHTFDSKQRIESFYKTLSEEWEDDYKDYRKQWHENPEFKIIPDYPLCIDLELSSACNLACPMCYTTTDHFKENVKRTNMSFPLIQKIIDEVAGKTKSLRLSWRGEPFLNPHFVETVKYAKEKGIKEVSSLTNGTYLNIEMFSKLADAGMDWITISIDGMLDEYDKIRAPLKFQDTYRRILEIAYFKKKNNLKKPLIKVQGVWNAISPNPQMFYDIFKPITDMIAFNPLIDYLGKDEIEQIVYEENFVCPKQYQRLFIGSDGRASICNADEFGSVDIGNAIFDSISSIWHGEKMNNFRKDQLEKDGFKKHEVCKRCFYPRKVSMEVVGQVDGRPIKLENYIGRKQEIGL
tara:strand:+ start:229 stop:1344 length:1116 start_codon:yes stop_codon:yes gene_type:complete